MTALHWLLCAVAAVYLIAERAVAAPPAAPYSGPGSPNYMGDQYLPAGVGYTNPDAAAAGQLWKGSPYPLARS